MTKATDVTEIEAIKKVIAEGGAMDYIDVVDAVEKRFRIKTSSATVEQVHHDMMNARTDSKQSPKPRVTFEMTSKLPVEEPSGQSTSVEPSKVDDDVALALQFVRSVGGISKAKRALEELETIMRG